MKLKHVTSNIIIEMEAKDINSLLVELTAALSTGSEVLAQLEAFSNDEIDGETLLDTLETGAITDLRVFRGYCQNFCSIIPAVNRYMKRSIDQTVNVTGAGMSKITGLITVYNDRILQCVKDGAEPYGDELTYLIKITSKVVGMFAYLIFYEFNILDVAAQLDRGVAEDDLDVDVAIVEYSRRYEVKISEFVTMVSAALAYNRPQLDIFDEFPELEDEFISIVGPYIVDIDETMLTEEVVRAIISGVVAPSDLFSMFLPEED